MCELADKRMTMDALLHEYDGVNAEILQRVQLQHTAIALLTALSGVALGLIVNWSDSLPAFVRDLRAEGTEGHDNIITGWFLLAVYAILVQSITAYWVYHQNHILTIGTYILDLSMRVERAAGVGREWNLLGWARWSMRLDKPGTIPETGDLLPPARISKIVRFIQPMILYGATVISLVCLLLLLKASLCKNIVSWPYDIFMMVVTVAELSMALATVYVQIGLSEGRNTVGSEHPATLMVR